MSEIPEVFAIFEQKLAHVLSFNLRQKGQKKAIEELLVYFSGIVGRASKAEARIAELEEKQRWIPVSERLPEAKGHYMAVMVDGFDDSRSVETLRYFGDGDWFTWSDWYVVTHWKEKPELPEVQE